MIYSKLLLMGTHKKLVFSESIGKPFSYADNNRYASEDCKNIPLVFIWGYRTAAQD